MNTTMSIRVLATGFLLACASAASAQSASSLSTLPLDDKVFVNISVGSQMRSTENNNDFSFPLYRETATVSTISSADGGAFFDVNAGYRFMPQLAVAIGFSSFGTTGVVQGAASIPNPLFFNRPAAVTISPVDADRSERSTYFMLVYSMPVAEKTDVSLFIGPSFTRVKQDLISSATVALGTQNLATTVGSESGVAKGVIVGADVAYQFRPMIGATAFLRYNGGSADLPSIKDVKTGGPQIGVGVRLRF
jgi:hypothetical protein